MKVLLVSHRFPPEGTAGTETYTAALAAALVARGHEVTVFAAAKDISAPDLTVRRREHAGITVHEVVNNLFHRNFRETWHHPRIDRIFGELLDRIAPDVAHFQHLLYLSSGCVQAAGGSGFGGGMMDYFTQDKIATLTAENQNLKFAASQDRQNALLTTVMSQQTDTILNRVNPRPIPAYQVANPNVGVNCCGCC